MVVIEELPSEELPSGLTIEELDPEEEFEGKRCEIHGLKSKPELNGTYCRSLKWDKQKQRMGVELPDGMRLAVKMGNLNVGVEWRAELPTPPPASGLPPTPSASAKANSDGKTAGALYLSVAGAQCAAVRDALRVRGLIEEVNGGMQSATVEHVVEVMERGGASAEVVSEALKMLTSVAGGQGKAALLSEEGAGCGAVVAAMMAHVDHAGTQKLGAQVLNGLAGGSAHGRSCIIATGGVRAVMRAMGAHPKADDVQLASLHVLEELKIGRASCRERV